MGSALRGGPANAELAPGTLDRILVQHLSGFPGNMKMPGRRPRDMRKKKKNRLHFAEALHRWRQRVGGNIGVLSGLKGWGRNGVPSGGTQWKFKERKKHASRKCKKTLEGGEKGKKPNNSKMTRRFPTGEA